MIMTPYIYLFIREDLSPPQQIIQTAHAVDELNKTIKAGDKTNHMVLFSSKSEMDLEYTSMFLTSQGIHHKMFYEPDISSHTAIATEPLHGDKRKLFSKYKLKR